MTSSFTSVGFCILFKRRTLHNLKYVRFASNLKSTRDAYIPGVTETIDVRSSKEYNVDHIPGAINLPVLKDLEHHIIGELYNSAPFEARKKGAGMVTHNIAHHIDTYFRTKDENYRPLIYCLRGGQRSRSLATILQEIGFSVTVLEGGYRTFRKQVMNDLETLPQKFQYRVIAGLTGCGKTYLLSQLSALGEQVLDLEGLAKHKGSILGLWYNEHQPTQKYFESQIVKQLRDFDKNRIVWLESESRKIGKVQIPDKVFEKICTSERYVINLPMQERVNHTVRDYRYFTEDFELLKQHLQKLKGYHSKETINKWISLGDNGQWEEFVEELLVNHYDPTYTRSQKQNNHGAKTSVVDLDSLSPQSVHRCLKNLIEDSLRTSVCHSATHL